MFQILVSVGMYSGFVFVGWVLFLEGAFASALVVAMITSLLLAYDIINAVLNRRD